MAVTKSLVFITCLCFARDLVFCDDYEEIGNEITLTPSIRGKPTEIVWKHNGNMVLWYDGSEMVEYRSFARRLVVDFETGQLTIRKLTSQDSGLYKSEIVINGKVQTSSHTVTILDVLPEPQVTCELDEASNVKKLLCLGESRTQLRYEWRGPNIKDQPGPELLVEEQEENLDSVYTCTVKNQANSKSTDFTLRDCHTGRAGTAVLVPVIIVTILLIILLILLGIFLYRRREKSRQSGKKTPDPEHGSLLRNYPTDVIPGSSEATLPSHTRLPPQKPSIVDKKWDQDNGAESSGETDEGQKLLKETKKLQEQNLKQSPQSAVSETNQEDTGKGELDKNVKKGKHAVEAEDNTYSEPDETEKERHKPREEEEEEKERSQKQESGDEEKFPEHQNKREEQKTEDHSEDNQTGEKEETEDRRDTETVSPQSAVTERMDTENEAEQQHTNEKKSQRDKGEHSVEQQNESMRNQKTKDAANSEEDYMRPGEKEKNQDGIDRTNTAEARDHPAVDQLLDDENAVEAEENTYSEPDETEKERHKQREEEEEKERSQKQESGDEEKFPEHQNKREEQKTEDHSEDNQTGEKEETEDRRDTVTDSPANLEKKPINSSDSSSNQTDRSNYTEQEKEEERKRPGLEQEGGQEQTAEEINPDPEIHEEQSCINTDKQDKQTDSDSVSAAARRWVE